MHKVSRNRYLDIEPRTRILLSPLALVTLAACGGGGGGGGTISSTPNSSSSITVGGSVVKGPLSNALVGLDYDGDGIVDSATVRTNADGSYSLTTSNTSYTVIAVSDESTIDASSGAVMSGITLKAPKGASVVTPTTTLIEEASLTKEQVAEVLGLPDGVDPLTFNPYAAGVDATEALAVEKASQQIMSVVNAFAGAAEGAGASQEAAFEAALTSVVEVVKTKASKLNDTTASDADKKLDLTDASDLALIKTEAITKVASTAGVNTIAFNNLAEDTSTAVKNVNAKIATVSDLTSDASKNAFSTTQVLADQVKTAATAEVSGAGTGNITFKDENVVATAASNKAPTDISLSANSISEDASSLVVGTLSTVDADQSANVAFTYKIAEISGTDYAAIGIDQSTGVLSLKAQPDYETKSSYNITILSIDEGGKKFSKAFKIDVTDANDAPSVANGIADQSIAEDSALSFQFASNTFADVDSGDSLTYTATLSNGSSLPSWLSFDASTRTFSGTPTNSDVGSIDVKVTVTDGSSAAVSDTFALTVTNVNDAPSVANGIADQSIAEDSALSFQFASNTFADVDSGDSLTYTATLSNGSSLPSWLSFDASTRTFSGTPTNSDVGSIDVKVTATDGSSAAVSDTFALTVTNVNDAPSVANGIADQSIAEDSALSFQFASNTFADVDSGDSLTYMATLSNGSSLPSWLSFDASTRTFSGTPTNSDVGSIDVKVTATDGSSAAVSDTFALTVTNVNDAPSVANGIADQSIAEDSALSFQFASNTFADVDSGDSLTYMATLSNGSSLPSWLSFDASTRTFSGTPTNSDVGSIDVKVTATDGSSAAVSDTFALTVTNVNDAPSVANGIADQSIAEDSALSFQFASNTFADVDSGDSLTYTATLSNGSSLPSWLSFDASTRTFSGTPTNSDVGSIDVKVTATDGSSAAVSDTFALTVTNVNDAPSVANGIADQSIAEDSALSFQFASNTFADVDSGDSLTYTATLSNGSSLPSWLSFDASTRTFSGTPTNSDVGSIDVKVTVTDGSSAAVSDTFALTVTNVNDAPTFASSPTLQVLEDEEYSYFVSILDPDFGDRVFVAADTVPSWLTYNSILKKLSGTPTNSEVGEHSVQFSVTDSFGATATQAFTLTVQNVNDNPTLEVSLSDKIFEEDKLAEFTIDGSTFADVDPSDTLTFGASLSSGGGLPSWLTFDPTTRKFSGTPKSGDIGTIEIALTATDSGGLSASDTFNLQVVNTNHAPQALTTSNLVETTWNGSQFAITSVSQKFSDIDAQYGDTLTYSATLKDGSALPSWLAIDATTGNLTGTAPTMDVRENPKTTKLDPYISATDTYDPNGSLRFETTYVTITAADKLGLTASTQYQLSPGALAVADISTINLKDYPLGSNSVSTDLPGTLAYRENTGNVLSLNSFSLDNANLQLAKDKTNGSWDTSTWPTSPEITLDISDLNAGTNFGNLGEISIFLGEVNNKNGTNYLTVEGDERYIELKFTADASVDQNGQLTLSYNSRLEGDIKYQANASPLGATVTVTQNETLQFEKGSGSTPDKIKINVLDLLDQLPFNGAVGALVPFEPGDFYVSIDGLPLESSSGEFIDLIDAQFTVV